MGTRKEWDRYTSDSLALGESSPQGWLFLSELGQHNYQDVHTLHSGLDTVKQLYSGNINPEAYTVAYSAFETGFNQIVTLGGHDWVVGSGAKGGYRLVLRNADIGLTVLYGSRFVELDDEGSHLKIELSPEYIHEHDIDYIESDLHRLSRVFLLGSMPCGVSVHLCADFQGWQPPADFESRFVTRSKRQAGFNTIDSLSLDTGTIAAVYGSRDSFLYGSASALQFAMYRKDKEIKAKDKSHYWSEKWLSKTDENFQPFYNDELPVWRFEYRFHHNVIKEFAEGLGIKLLTLKQLHPHLNGLWRYACTSYRLDASRTYIDPFWQLLRDDVAFTDIGPHLLYKRVRKGPGVGNQRNVAAAIGNLITLYAKNGFTAKQAMHYLESSGIYHDFLAWQMNKQFSRNEMYQYLDHELARRRLLGKAA